MTTATPAPIHSGRTGWLAAGLVTLVLLGLHGWLLVHAGAFCGDEVNVINLAGTHSLGAMTRDSFPVLLPVLVGGWQALGLGGTNLGLRLLGFLVGVGVTGALWLPALAARRAPPWWGLILFGLNGTAIFWTDYLRAYGLGTLLLLLTLAAIVFLLQKPSWRRTGILGLAAVLSVQALYQNAVFFAGMALGGWLVCWLRKDKSAALKIFAAALAAALSLLPYLGPIWRWRQGTSIRPGFSFVAALDNLETMLAFPLPQYVWLWLVLGLAVMGLGLAAGFRRPAPGGVPSARTPGAQLDTAGNWGLESPQNPPTGRSALRGGLTPAECQVFAGTVLISSAAGYLVFLHLAAMITSPWYFLPLLAVGAACFDLGISLAALPGWLRTAVRGILLGTVGLAAVFGARDLDCRFSNMDLVTGRLVKEISPQDYVLVTPWYLGISFNHYYHGAAAWDSLPPVADHSTYRFDLVPAAAADLAHASQPVLGRMANTLRTGHRVWVVGWMSVPAPHHAASTVEGGFLAQHSRSFAVVDLHIQGRTSDYEDVALLRAEGWGTNSP